MERAIPPVKTLSPAGGVDNRAFLDAIVAGTRRRVERLYACTSIPELLSQGRRFERRSLREALTRDTPAIIAEIKKASPSKGLLSADFDPVRLAHAYCSGGAVAYSVVTEPEYFHGDGGWIAAVRDCAVCPILRKDFLIDEIQIAESAALGADAVLLIARILSRDQMSGLASAAAEAKLEILYEAHSADDLDRILTVDPQIVGINARDLETFAVDTGVFARLRERIPRGVIALAESGIDSADQVQTLVRMGYTAFLVGESLIRSADPAARIRELRGLLR